MKDWTRIEAGYYRHISGATVYRLQQRRVYTIAGGGAGGRDRVDSCLDIHWAFKMPDREAFSGFGTMREAMQQVIKELSRN